ncbi:MAG: hypothetical protein MK209_08745 [Planctomycetes bacterium]|nr:hypothetical protein [Planctomycetota bacterium]
MRKEIRQALMRRPEWVEPGVLLQDQSIKLPGEAGKLRLHGVDVLGRPCLVGVFRELDAAAYDWMLAVVCAFRDGLLGGDPVYSRGREPRLFVVAPWYRPEDLARLALLADAVPVRALRVRRNSSEGWVTELVQPRHEFPDDPAHWLDQAPESMHGFLKRLRSAGLRGVHRCDFQGEPWPLLLMGAQRPVAAIHREGDRVLFLAVDEPGMPARVIDLQTESGQDTAIDHVLRSHGELAAILT